MQALEGRLKLKTVISNGGEKTVMQNNLDCTLALAENGEFVIKYTLDGSKIITKLSGKKASILRLGDNRLSMKIVPGKLTPCRMNTEEGVLCFDTKGIDVQYSLDKSGGKAKLKYSTGNTVTIEMEITEKV